MSKPTKAMLCELNQAVRMVCERGITKHLIVFTSTTQSGFQSHFEEFVKKIKHEGLDMATYTEVSRGVKRTSSESENVCSKKVKIELEEGIHVDAKSSNAFRKQTKAVLKRHKIKTFDLTIKKSMIPNSGQGVFNRGRTIPRYTMLGPYPGIKTWTDEIEDRYSNTPESESLSVNQFEILNKDNGRIGYIDPGTDFDVRSDRGWMHKANHNTDSKLNNLKPIALHRHNDIYFMVTRDILYGEELYLYYSEYYDNLLKDLH